MTSDAQFQYHYFEHLEALIKKGSAAYLLLFLTGTLILIVDPVNFAALLSNHLFELLLSLLLFLTAGFFGFYFLLTHFGWLSGLHIRLDKMFLGFLIRSNDVIYTTLISALPEQEQIVATGFSGEVKEKLAQSIFTRVSTDSNLFDLLLRSDIFRFWMGYWIFLYGIFAFSLLTAVAFAAVILRAGAYDKAFFTVSWCLAILHVSLSIVMGKYIIRIMVSTVTEIVDAHKDTIAQIIRENLPAASMTRLSQEEDASYEDLR